MRARLTLPAQLRLRRKREFDAAYARGRRMSDGLFTVTLITNDTGGPRLGTAVDPEIQALARCEKASPHTVVLILKSCRSR